MSKYLDLLKDPRWQKKRLKIFDRDEWRCRLCEDGNNTLNVHHLKYDGKPWEVEDKYLVTLCERCHKDEEQLKLNNPVLKELSNKGAVLATTLVDFLIQISYVRWNDPEQSQNIFDVFDHYNKHNGHKITDFFQNG